MKNRLGVDIKDPATWRGLGWMITGYAMDAFDPATNKWFIPLMILLIGAVGFFVKDPPENHGLKEIDQPDAPDLPEKKEPLDELVKRHQR